MSKKILCCEEDGKIYYGSVLKSGELSQKDRVEMTDDCIEAVLNHLLLMDDFKKIRFAGYNIPSKDKTQNVWLNVFDSELYEVSVKPEVKQELETKAKAKVVNIPKKPRRSRKKKEET